MVADTRAALCVWFMLNVELGGGAETDRHLLHNETSQEAQKHKSRLVKGSLRRCKRVFTADPRGAAPIGMTTQPRLLVQGRF